MKISIANFNSFVSKIVQQYQILLNAQTSLNVPANYYTSWVLMTQDKELIIPMAEACSQIDTYLTASQFVLDNPVFSYVFSALEQHLATCTNTDGSIGQARYTGDGSLIGAYCLQYSVKVPALFNTVYKIVMYPGGLPASVVLP